MLYEKIVIKDVLERESKAGKYLVVNTEDKTFFVWAPKLFEKILAYPVGQPVAVWIKAVKGYEHIAEFDMPEITTADKLLPKTDLEALKKIHEKLRGRYSVIVDKIEELYEFSHTALLTDEEADFLATTDFIEGVKWKKT